MRAWVLSGGGEKGAYQAGVVEYLVTQGDVPQMMWGISVGAMNSYFLAQYGQSDLPYGVMDLKDLWLKIKTEDVVKHWWLPYIASLWKGSVYCSAPQRAMIDKHVKQGLVMSSPISLGVVSVDWLTGEAVVGRGTDPNIPEHVKASSSFPVFMEPVMVGDRLCTDGGLRDVAPLKYAIQDGATDITVIACSNPDLPDLWQEPGGVGSLFKYVKRAIDVRSNEMVHDDFRECGLKNELAKQSEKYQHVNVRIIRPSEPLGTESLHFSPEQARRLIDLGYEDAKRAASSVTHI